MHVSVWGINGKALFMRHGGMLIFWIIILFPDLQNCAAIFVRKQTGNAAPPSRIYFKPRLYMQRKKNEEENTDRDSMRNKNLKWSKIAGKRGVEVTLESKGREKAAPFKSSRVKVTVLTCSVLWCIRPVWVMLSGASAAHRDVCAGGKGTVPAHSTNGNNLSPHRWEEAYWTSHLCPLIVIKNLKFSPPASDPSSLGQAPACIITIIIIMQGFFLFLTVSLRCMFIIGYKFCQFRQLHSTLQAVRAKEALHCLCGFLVAEAETRQHADFNDLRLDWLRSPLKIPVCLQQEGDCSPDSERDTRRTVKFDVYGRTVEKTKQVWGKTLQISQASATLNGCFWQTVQTKI